MASHSAPFQVSGLIAAATEFGTPVRIGDTPAAPRVTQKLQPLAYLRNAVAQRQASLLRSLEPAGADYADGAEAIRRKTNLAMASNQ
jgi:hypothetical protein